MEATWWEKLWEKLGLVLMGRAMLSKYLIQFSTWDQTVVEVKKIVVTSFKRSHACTDALSAPTLQQTTSNPRLCQRLLDTDRQAWLSLLWGHCSFLLGLGVHRVLFVPSKSLFPQSCESSVIKFHWPPNSKSFGVLSPFVRSPDWEICCGS